jgi:hypothetical protein
MNHSPSVPNRGVAMASLAFCVLVGGGCRSLGPGTVPRDRYDYSSAISESWKRQALLNIVKLRYLDPPIFVDVGQIVAGYSVETGGNAGGQLSSSQAIQGNSLLFGANIKYTDRPTITYTPLTGNKFLKGLMTPLTPESVFFTIQSGWPADGVLLASVAAINGLKNQETSFGGVTPPAPDFLRTLALLRKIQLSGAVGMRVLQDPAKGETTLLTFQVEGIAPETLADVRELRQLLRLDPEAGDFKLVFGATPANDREVAVLTRSILHLMQTMASQIDIPAEDLAASRAVPGWESAAAASDALRMVHIRSSDTKPHDAFVEINYRGHWFWIDDRDLRTKRIFGFMMMLFTLADTSERESLPMITIPAQ